jgi:hypothetical protein
VCIQFLIAGRDIEKKKDAVLAVGYGRQDLGSVVCRGGKLRSDRRPRDCVDRMMIWRPDEGLERKVIEAGVQTLNSVLGWMLERN